MNTIESFIKETELSTSFSRYNRKETTSNELSLEEEFLIWHYTGGGSDSLNKALRDNTHDEYFKFYEHYLNKALNKLSTYEGDSYRGQKNISSEELELYEKAKDSNKAIKIFCFYSTTTALQVARNKFMKPSNHQKTFFTIAGKRGRKVEKLSQHPEEKEILFQSQSFFWVREIYEERKVIYIELEEV